MTDFYFKWFYSGNSLLSESIFYWGHPILAHHIWPCQQQIETSFSSRAEGSESNSSKKIPNLSCITYIYNFLQVGRQILDLFFYTSENYFSDLLGRLWANTVILKCRFSGVSVTGRVSITWPISGLQSWKAGLIQYELQPIFSFAWQSSPQDDKQYDDDW